MGIKFQPLTWPEALLVKHHHEDQRKIEENSGQRPGWHLPRGKNCHSGYSAGVWGRVQLEETVALHRARVAKYGNSLFSRLWTSILISLQWASPTWTPEISNLIFNPEPKLSTSFCGCSCGPPFWAWWCKGWLQGWAWSQANIWLKSAMKSTPNIRGFCFGSWWKSPLLDLTCKKWLERPLRFTYCPLRYRTK